MSLLLLVGVTLGLLRLGAQGRPGGVRPADSAVLSGDVGCLRLTAHLLRRAQRVMVGRRGTGLWLCFIGYAAVVGALLAPGFMRAQATGAGWRVLTLGALHVGGAGGAVGLSFAVVRAHMPRVGGEGEMWGFGGLAKIALKGGALAAVLGGIGRVFGAIVGPRLASEGDVEVLGGAGGVLGLGAPWGVREVWGAMAPLTLPLLLVASCAVMAAVVVLIGRGEERSRTLRPG